MATLVEFLTLNIKTYSAPADNPFHISQLSIVLESTNELLEGFASGIQGGSFDTSSPE